jgi:hypothetical protein
MAKKRTDVMQDDPLVMIYLIVVLTALLVLGMSMA